MTKRILAIAFIYCCTALAWAVLGSTIYDRTNSSEGRLKEKVVSTWGTRQAQEAPAAFSEKTETRIVNDELRVSVNGSPAADRMQGQSIVTPAKVPAGDSVVFAVAYRSQGLDERRYRLGGGGAEAASFRVHTAAG